MNQPRETARKLRAQGLTYSEIEAALGRKLPRSTMSYWFKDITLTRQQQNRIREVALSHLADAREAAVRSKAQRSEERSRRGAQKAHELMAPQLSTREAKLALAMLYLGEGGKYPSTRGLALGSSDPRIVKLYIRLLGHCFGVKPDSLRCAIYFRADQDLVKLINYWSAELALPRKNFYKSSHDPRTRNAPTRNTGYMGVARISCKGVEMQLELDHIANALLEVVSPPSAA